MSSGSLALSNVQPPSDAGPEVANGGDAHAFDNDDESDGFSSDDYGDDDVEQESDDVGQCSRLCGETEAR